MYWSAWGYEVDNWNYVGEYDEHGSYHLGIAMVLLDVSFITRPIDDGDVITKVDTTKYVKGTRGNLRGTGAIKPILLINTHQ